MSLKIGSTAITGVKHGSTDVESIRHGSTLVWTRTTLFDNYNRADADTLGADWTDEGPALTYTAGVSNNTCRLVAPDLWLLGLAYQESWQRYDAATSADDDGYLEAAFSTTGSLQGPSSSPHITMVLRRGSDGAATHGVGFAASASNLYLAARIAEVDTLTAAGTFSPGDTIRCYQTGAVHTLRRNGALVAEWDDAGGTAESGPGYRSLLIQVTGSQDWLGARRFSPSIDYVECS